MCNNLKITNGYYVPYKKLSPFSCVSHLFFLGVQICEFALNAMTGTTPKEEISIPAQQQIIATWVKTKQLNQQQIRHELGTQEEV